MFALLLWLSTICQRLDKFGSFFYYATGGVCVPADGVEKGECTPTTRFTRRSGCTRSRLDTSVSRRTLTAIAVRRLPLSPPVSTEFEHNKDGIYFRQWCCGLCGIQVKKESNEKTVALFLFLNTISIIFNCGTIAQIL